MVRTKKLFLTTRAVFKNIREQGGVYVDKTKQIYDCIGKDTYFFLARPRRFGKSTLCRTLQELFLGNRKLFKGLWIDKSDWGWEKHPVIYLDMTDAAGERNTIEAFDAAIHEMLGDIAQDYGVKVASKKTVNAHFKGLIKSLHKKFNIGVVVIIDEYDKPILDLAATGAEYKWMHSAISDLYAVLKPAEEQLRFVFMTGVFKFTQTSVFSKLNNLNDLTFNFRAGDLVGYTQEELESNFSDEINLLAAKVRVDYAGMCKLLKAEYNGYHFGVDVSAATLAPAVYNPFAINHTFAENQMVRRWFASGSPRLLIEKIKEGKFEQIRPSGLMVDFDELNTSCNPDAITGLSLLYYAGYATIAEYIEGDDTVRLGYPNTEVAVATANQLVALFVTPGDAAIQRLAKQLGQAFKNNELDQVHDLFEQVFAHLTYQIFVSHEKYFQSMIMLVLIMGKLRVEAEVPTEQGRADLVVYVADRIFVIETKFNVTAEAGLDQIKNNRYMTKFKTMGLPVEAVGINIAYKKGLAKSTARAKDGAKKSTKKVVAKAPIITVAWVTVFKPVRKRVPAKKAR